MTRSYKVAGHIFNLTMRDSCTLWNDLQQYEPFRQEEPCREPAFTLYFDEGEFPGASLTEVLVPETEPGETFIKVFSTPQGWCFEFAPDSSLPMSARLTMNSDFTEARLYPLSRSRNLALFSINNAMMLTYAFRTITEGTLEMHASMVSNGGRAYLFLARSGTGKSTHSSLWLKNIPGTELMNDDNPVVRVWPDGRVVAYGSPWSGKTSCYKNVEAPVGAFVRIRRCAENRIEELSALDAYVLLHSSTSGLKFDSAMCDGLHESLQGIIGNIPCYVLDCRPDDEAARVCFEKVSSDGR